jgi:hypothetical protein
LDSPKVAGDILRTLQVVQPIKVDAEAFPHVARRESLDPAPDDGDLLMGRQEGRLRLQAFRMGAVISVHPGDEIAPAA